MDTNFVEWIIRIIRGQPPAGGGGTAYSILLALLGGLGGALVMLRMLNESVWR